MRTYNRAQRTMEHATTQVCDAYQKLAGNNLEAERNNPQYQAMLAVIDATLRQLRALAPNTFPGTYDE